MKTETIAEENESYELDSSLQSYITPAVGDYTDPPAKRKMQKIVPKIPQMMKVMSSRAAKEGS